MKGDIDENNHTELDIQMILTYLETISKHVKVLRSSWQSYREHTCTVLVSLKLKVKTLSLTTEINLF